jgi:hypothetical protein
LAHSTNMPTASISNPASTSHNNTTRSFRRSLLRKLLGVGAIAGALAVAPFSARAAEAAECTTHWSWHGNGWGAIMECYLVEAISVSGTTCIEIDGHYYTVQVHCSPLAVVEVRG